MKKKVTDQNQIEKVGQFGPETPPQRLRLIELMERHKLTAKAAGELLGRSERTVLIWRCDGGKEIPLTMLELLELKLDKGGK
ncbi:hypothetical protein [Tatumella sp. UCD-D_suzukii]|uniref:hypothetical protein n=1 Tax=Tatumella sp. UCD-D_suzukii TaxID=1408192 RepID=UPI000472DC70|nr:hypothetical protein [Tatumella sp. UCD-D_suzukii]